MKGNNNGVAAIAEKLKIDSTYQKLQQYEQKILTYLKKK